jgi:hypothetical protein
MCKKSNADLLDYAFLVFRDSIRLDKHQPNFRRVHNFVVLQSHTLARMILRRSIAF